MTHTQAGKGARGVQTNGIGKTTSAHLNLTKSMVQQVAAEEAERSIHATMSHKRRAERLHGTYYPNRFKGKRHGGAA